MIILRATSILGRQKKDMGVMCNISQVADVAETPLAILTQSDGE
jgi:hypothetical protein